MRAGWLRPAGREVGDGLGADLQLLMVEVAHLAQQRRVVRVARQRRVQLRDGGAPRAHGAFERDALAEQLDGVTEGDSLGLHDEVDRPSAGTARTQTVPDVLLLGDNEARRLVGVKTAKPHPVVVAGLLEDDAARLGQPSHADLTLQSLQLHLRDSRHSGCLRKRVKALRGPATRH
jgi:hypothetical protein